MSYPEVLSSGAATYTTSFATVGSHTLTASYSGDNAYLASQAALTISALAPDFTLAAASTALTVSNNTASAIITLSSVGGFNGQTNFACSLPAALTEAGCTITPPTLSGAGQTTLAVTTRAAQSKLEALPKTDGGSRIVYALGLFPILSFALLLPKRSRLRSSLMVLSTFALLAWTGCGGHPPATPLDPGSPAGTYVVTVTATSTQGATMLQRTLPFQLSVP